MAIFIFFCSSSNSVSFPGLKLSIATVCIAGAVSSGIASNVATSTIQSVSHNAVVGAKNELKDLGKDVIKSSLEEIWSSKTVDLIIKKVAISSMSFATGMAGLFASGKIFVDGTREYTEAKKNNNQSLKKQAKIKMVSSACGFALTPPLTIAAIAKGLKQ